MHLQKQVVKFFYEILPRRLGDVVINYTNASVEKSLLSWSASRSLDEMCTDTWRLQSSNPNGFTRAS